ncbi:MAG TPA: phospholipid carrier-dependent glycosyltransferase [Candidatus Polarisedimenticolia bacterium]|nr:phospholipid carrier-dependent glycosyltransferase [Candidatus Polarisedimenticolia bacterium]
MTGPAAGEPDRGKGEPQRTTAGRDTASGILWILAIGLALRVIIAYLLPGSGFSVDLGAFRYWADNLADNGLYGFYDRPFFHDYTPGYLYVLWLIGGLGNLLNPGHGPGDLIKIPAIVADVGLAWIVWLLLQDLGAGRRAARIGAAVVLFNPVSWFDSVLFGQVDSVGVVVLLFAMRELWHDRPERSAVLTVLALLIKPQLAILAPIVAAVTIRRALRPEGAYGDDPPPEPRWTTTRWEREARGWIRIVTTGAAGLITAVLLSLPFGLSLPGLVGQIFKTAGGYPYVSVNAYNPWALFTVRGDGVAANRQWLCDVQIAAAGHFNLGPFQFDYGGCYANSLSFGAIPAVAVGAALLIAALVAVSIVVARRPDRRTILVGLAILAIAFFVLPTRVHERYLYPFIAIAAPLAAVSWRWRPVYVLSSAALLANLYAVLTTLYQNNPSIRDWFGIGDEVTSWWGVAIGAGIQAVTLGFAFTELRRSATRRVADEVVATADEATWDGEEEDEEPIDEPPERGLAPGAPVLDGGPALQSPGLRPAPLAPRPALALASASAAPAVAPVELWPAWRPRLEATRAGYWQWFVGRLRERPYRPDRSAAVAGERGGRLDRLDVWVLAVFVIVLLTTRVWRLAEPAQMHFDEVYHARTGMEFLQDWRYGISQYIYEYTHPHLAKYAMAEGIVLWGEDETSATSDLGVPVTAAAIEPRWDENVGKQRTGDRLWVATGSEVIGYDLATRAEVIRLAVPGARAIAVDKVGHRVIAGDGDGRLTVLATQLIETPTPGVPPLFRPIGQPLGGPVHLLAATSDGLGFVAALDDGTVISLDAGGTELGRTTVKGPKQLADGGSGPVVIAHTHELTDREQTARRLAIFLARPTGEIQALLERERLDVVVGSVPAGETRTNMEQSIADGELPGIEITNLTRLAIAGDDGVTFISPTYGDRITTVSVGGPANGVAGAIGLDHDRLYVSYDATDGPRVAKIAISGTSAANGPLYEGQFKLPSRGSWVYYDQATQMVHVLAERPDVVVGPPIDHPDPPAPTNTYTIYVIEPHANAVYADAHVDIGTPVALVLDDNQRYPATDRQQFLGLDASGHVATIETGRHAFAWRLPGVLAGVLMGALLYILARILFRRRLVALLVAFLVSVDGMLFVTSRIGMNDPYVGVFLVLAYTLFAAIWTRDRWDWRGWLAFAIVMPLIGVSLGLALASKWVAAYAIGALGILVLTRSALGRVLLVGGLILATTVLGYLAVSVPEGQSGGNLLFAMIMISLTLAAVALIVIHPIAWTRAEYRVAVYGPAALGALTALAAVALGGADARSVINPETRLVLGSVAVTPLEAGFALLILAFVVHALFVVAGRWGFGPLAAPPLPDDPASLLEPAADPPRGWLNLGSGFGLSGVWALVSLVAIPIAVYIASYLPWAFVEDHRITDTWPPGHKGQTLAQLTKAMYDYHNQLSAPHAASSPWWAWPFDFKPVWFYQESFAGGTAAAIYDAGNLIAWWLAIPALAFAAWWAFSRRSPALALIVIGFACQWLAWARIDRAAFQYHYYTSLPFVILALAYFIAELWNGASQRTWLVARLAAGAAVLAPTALWLLHRPLCGLVGVTSVNPGSRACPTLIPDLLLTARTAAIAAVVGVGVLILLGLLTGLGRRSEDDFERDDGGGVLAGLRRLLPIGVAAAGVAMAFVVARAFFPESPILTMTNVPVEPIAGVALIAILPIAAYVATARDARRFVIGAVFVIGAWFVLWYPNLSALPLPIAMSNTYQGVLPTYVYPFQFPVSTLNRSGPGPQLFALGPLLLLAALTLAVLILAYSAWVWRIALAERAAEERYATPLDTRGEAGMSAR